MRRIFQLIIIIGFFCLSLPGLLPAVEDIHFVMFGPDIKEDHNEVLGGLAPFVDWLNARIPFKLVPHFFKNPEKLDAFLNTHPTGFAMLDMSFFLEKRKKHGFVPFMKPIVNNRDTYQIVLVTRKNNTFRSPRDLKGRRVSITSQYAGTHRFYSRAVFNNQIDIQKEFHLVYARNAYSAMIDVINKTSLAALVWGKDFTSMCELNPAARRDLKILYSSEEFPFHPFVYLRNQTTLAQLKSLSDQMIKQTESAEGRQLLMIFRYEGWSPVKPHEYDKLIAKTGI